MIQLISTVRAVQDQCYGDIHAINLRVWEDFQAPWYEAEFEASEIAYDALQEERAIYHGMTEAEFLRRYPDDDDDDYPSDWPDEPEPSYEDMIMRFDGRTIYVHCDCQYCIGHCQCAECREPACAFCDEPIPEPHPERQHPNGYGLRWELVNLWHLVRHWFW